MDTNKRIFISIATASVFVSVSVQARFLQTDPVGYKDDLNLYTYVKNDPMNAVDPTGLRCTGIGNESVCKLDYFNDKKVDQARKDGDISKSQERQIARLERNVTKAYRSAQEKGKDTITVKGDQSKGIKDTEVSGDRIAMVLQDQPLRASTEPYFAKGRQEADATASADKGITFWRRGFQQPIGPRGDYSQQNSAIHESLHFVPYLSGWSGYDLEHQDPFLRAVEQLLGPRPAQ